MNQARIWLFSCSVLALCLSAACGDEKADGGQPSADGSSAVDAGDGGMSDVLPDGDEGSDDVGSDAAGPGPERLDCPGTTAFPFGLEVAEGEWASASNGTLLAESQYDKTNYVDVYGNPGDPQVIAGALAVGATGLDVEVLAGETVSHWTYDPVDGDWRMLRRQQTGGDGSWSLELDPLLGPGSHEVYTVFEAARRCYTHNVMVWPEGTQVILSDIDGTLTSGDSELFEELGDSTYDQRTKIGAVELITTWSEKGYLIVYLTARPGEFRVFTDAWRLRRGLPAGLSQFADGLVFDESARVYKAAFIRSLLDMGLDIVAVYGNATSDIAAYADAGLPLETTFIIGEYAGTEGTVAIENDDYTSHIESYVASQPDAVQPAELAVEGL